MSRGLRSFSNQEVRTGKNIQHSTHPYTEMTNYWRAVHQHLLICTQATLADSKTLGAMVLASLWAVWLCTALPNGVVDSRRYGYEVVQSNGSPEMLLGWLYL